jgi:hypothetical protein
MIARRDSLEQALEDVESGKLTRVSTIVVNLQWWKALAVSAQEGYRRRADRAGVEVRADNALSAHFVEVRGGEEGPPLSTERPV